MSGSEENDASENRTDAADELVAVALAVKTRGLRGEVVANLLTDFPERFEQLQTLIAVGADGKRETLILEEHWFQNARIVLKFAGYDSVETAKTLVGYEFAVPETERVELSENEFYDWELAGCEVLTIDDERIGCVVSVMRTGGVEMLVVENTENEKRDYLIPLAETICVEIDIEQKRIRVDLPEGLLEF
jgi:16S rRNA processing protein RimM